MKKIHITMSLILLSSQLVFPITSFAEELTQNSVQTESDAKNTEESIDSTETPEQSTQTNELDNSVDEQQDTSESTSENSEIKDSSDESIDQSTTVPDRSAAYSIDGVVPQAVSQVNSFTMVSLAYSGKGQSLEDFALPSNFLSVSVKVVNFSNTEEVIPAGTKINFSASETKGLLVNNKILKKSSYFNSDDETFSIEDELDGSISIIFNVDFYPGENTSQLILMYQDPGYNWDNSGATNDPTIVNTQLTSSFKDDTSTTEIQSFPLYLKPNKKSDSNTGGGISGFALPGPSSPLMTSPGYDTDKQGAGGGYFYYIHDPAALDSNNKPYFSYTTGMNLLVWGRQAGGSLEHKTNTHPFDIDATRLYVQNIDGSIEDITNSSGVNWITRTPDTIKVSFVEFSQNNPNAKIVFLRTYIPVDSLMDTNISTQTAFNDNGITVNGGWKVTSVFADPLSSSDTPYFRGPDLTVYDTDRISAMDSLYANIGTKKIDNKNIIVTDFDGYPDFDSNSIGADVVANPGVYNISYSVTSSGVTTDFNRKITVLKNQTALNVTDSTIYKGTSWIAQDNFANALDKDGNSVDFSKITATGTVDVNTPGVYTVTYTYESIKKQAKVTVVENQETLVAKNSILYTGNTWNAKDNFISATDTSGKAVDFSSITTKGSVDTTVPGNYEITYSYGSLTKTVIVTVKKDQSQITLKDSTIYVGDTWSAQDNFISASNEDGTKMDLSALLVSGSVDTSKVGENTITYSYNNQSAIAKINVIENKQTLMVKNSTIYVGDSWENQDNFVSATDKDGNNLDFSIINVTGGVDTNTIGDYTVLYTSGKLKKLAVVTVLENKQTITGEAYTMYVGDKTPTAEDFKATATDKTGASSEVSADLSKADLTKAGIYDVTLSSKDGQTTEVKLTVLNKPMIEATDKTMYVGDKLTNDIILSWAKFINSENLTTGFIVSEKGIPISSDNLLTKAGKYTITYYTKDKKNSILAEKVITLTVLTKNGHSSDDNKKSTDTIVSGTKEVSNTTASGTGKNFPSTGEQNTHDLYLLGASMLALVGIFFFRKKQIK